MSAGFTRFGRDHGGIAETYAMPEYATQLPIQHCLPLLATRQNPRLVGEAVRTIQKPKNVVHTLEPPPPPQSPYSLSKWCERLTQLRLVLPALELLQV